MKRHEVKEKYKCGGLQFNGSYLHTEKDPLLWSNSDELQKMHNRTKRRKRK